MKCEHCGKNELTFVYQRNINGKVTEKHLCGECARELGYSQRIAAHNQNMMQHFFGDSFFGGSLLDDFFAPMPSLMSRMNRMLESPFEDFFADMPALGAAPEQKEEQQKDLVDREEQSRFAEMRKKNALRMELKKAVRQEDFERAAQLRDQIRALEAEKEERKESK